VPVARALARRRFVGRGLLVTLLGAPFILPVIVAVLGLLAVFGSERFRVAAQLGLTPRAVFAAIEVPILRQVLPGAFALVFVMCLTSFAVALTLGGGPRATTIELAILQAFRFDFDLGRAAFLSVLQLGVAGGAALLALWFVPALSVGGGLDRPVQRWDAGGRRARVLDTLAIGFAGVLLLAPLAAIVVRGVLGLGQMPSAVWGAAGNSVVVALLSVLMLALFALPLAGWIATSTRGGVEAVGLLGLSASPLMIGTGWFIVINPFADPAGFTLVVTALVNAMMALPFVLRILVPPMRDVARDYARLCQSLGMSGWAVWRWVVLPRVRAPLGFAAGLTAALSVGDLGVVTLFADPDRNTLPLQMYRLMGAYRMDAAAGAALVLLALALGMFWIMDKAGRWRAEV